MFDRKKVDSSIKPLLGGGYDLGGVVVNEACVQNGKRLTQRALADQAKRREASVNDSYDCAHEAAKDLRNAAVGRIISAPTTAKMYKIKPIFCFICEERAYSATNRNGKWYCREHLHLYDMPNEQRRHLNIKQDPDLPDYQETKGMEHAEK